MDENPSSNIHVSNLKPFHQDLNDKQPNNGVRPSIDLKQKEDKQVEEILADRVRNGRKLMRRIHEFLVKGKNLPVEETSWEHVEDLEAWEQKIEEFQFRPSTGTQLLKWGRMSQAYLSRVLFAYGHMPKYPRTILSLCLVLSLVYCFPFYVAKLRVTFRHFHIQVCQS